MEACIESCNQEDFYEAMESKLMWMNFMAHKQLLFEKIKQKIEEQEGEKLDKIVDLVVQASKEDWQDKKEQDRKHEELRNKLRDLFEA